MSDDLVPERHLGLWKEEGRSSWSAVLTQVKTQPVFYLPGERPRATSYVVRLDAGMINMRSGDFFWSPTHTFGMERATREEAKLEAAATIDEMIANLRVIAASLRGEPDCQTTPPPK